MMHGLAHVKRCYMLQTPSGKNLVLKGVSNADEGFTVGRSGHLRLIQVYLCKTGKEGDAQRLRSHTMHGERYNW
jgi:hypothetical protein